MKLVWLWCALCLWPVGAGACRSSVEQKLQAAAGKAKPVAPRVSVAAAVSEGPTGADAARVAVAPVVPSDLGDPAQQFLVHAASGEIVLRSRATGASRLLAKHADTALYHAALELVWFLDADRLSVVDLRASGAPPVIVARGAPTVGHLSISHPTESVETEDGCDVPYLSLDWTATPKVEAFLTEAPNLHIENAAWLQAQLARTARAAGSKRDFSNRRVRLPPKLLDCEDKEACGKTVSFGLQGLALVRVLEKPGGDCVQRACLMRDPRTRLFASPPQIDAWGPAETTPRGTCGPFLFDQAQSAFLVGHHLCLPDHRCEDLKADALGWLVPGDSVGAPGNFAGP